MWNKKYKHKSNRIKIIIIALVVMFIILLIMSTLSNIAKKEKEEELQRLSGVLENIQDVIKYYECTYISEKKSAKQGYDIDVELIFKYPLYKDDISNENFYNKLLEELAKITYYRNFRMIDKQNDIEVEVTCLDKKIQEILINGRRDYFIYMNSQISLKEYQEIKETQVTVNSNALITAINGNWSDNVDFGTRDSIFQNYYIYFERGIEVRRLSGQIYNIIFTEKYQGEVLHGITVGTDLDLIQRSLGTASFEDKDLGIIGYKCKEFYIFFSKDEISVYRRGVKETEGFFKLLDKLLNNQKNLNDFLNELTYLWPDYSEYIRDVDSFFISYPLRGLDIKYNYDDTSGIIIYNNFNATERTISEYIEHTELIARLKIDNVFEAEKRRKDEKDNLMRKSRLFKVEVEQQEKAGESQRFAYYADLDENGYIMTVYFISRNKSDVNSELNETIDTYTWVGNDYFVYSIRNKGIYGYNVAARTKWTILSGTDNYQIREYSNNILKYDNKEIKID